MDILPNVQTSKQRGKNGNCSGPCGGGVRHCITSTLVNPALTLFPCNLSCALRCSATEKGTFVQGAYVYIMNDKERKVHMT